MELEQLILEVKNTLSEKRFIHSMGVMKQAEKLAKIYGEDSEKAKKVGIIHDIAKEMSEQESTNYVKENQIEIDEIEACQPSLLHAKIGADIAKRKYGFDLQMQKAILYHTVANQEMDLLAKIIYVADKTEENRNSKSIDVEKERQLSYQNLDEAVISIIEGSIRKSMGKNSLIHPISIWARNELIKNRENNMQDKNCN